MKSVYVMSSTFCAFVCVLSWLSVGQAVSQEEQNTSSLTLLCWMHLAVYRVPSEDSVLTCAGAAPLDHEVTHENVVDKHSCDKVSGERSQQLSTN